MTDQETMGLANAVSTLSADFPHVPRTEIEGMVSAERGRFDGRPVRVFVPVLAERAVRARLRSGGLRASA